VTRNIYI